MFSALMLFAAAVVASAATPPALELVFDAFLHARPEGMSGNQTERSRPDDLRPPAYFEKALALKRGSVAAVIAMQELRVRAAPGGVHHLGLAHLRFKDASAASALQRTASSGNAYFAGTKVLTHYVVQRMDAEVLVLFSETPDSAWVDGFLRRASTQQEVWWRN